jgi:hypothetical protein
MYSEGWESLLQSDWAQIQFLMGISFFPW